MHQQTLSTVVGQKEYEGSYLLAVIEHHGLRNVVDGERQSCPPGNDNGKDSRPDGQQGNDDEEGGGDGANNVGPDSGAVHYAHEGGSAADHQGAVVAGKHNLEVTLYTAKRNITTGLQRS